MNKNILTDKLLEPLNSARTAKLYLHTGDGNLMVERLTSGEPVLANGTLQYFQIFGFRRRRQ